MKVNVLGTIYRVIKREPWGEEKDGEAFFYSKSILIRKKNVLLCGDATKKERKARQKEVLRHELWHCFFHECGADKYAYDEELVSILERITPHVFETMKQIDCL